MFKHILPILVAAMVALPVAAKEPAILSVQPESRTVGLYEKIRAPHRSRCDVRESIRP